MSHPLIVVIDDDEWMSAHVARVLKKHGYEVEAVPHAIEGMQLIDRTHPAAIILDLFMPGPNAFVLLHELRSHSDLSQIPIILCTNSARELGDYDLGSYGVHIVLDKTTMQPDDLVAAVRRVTS